MSYAANHSPQNFAQPDSFRPERWLNVNYKAHKTSGATAKSTSDFADDHSEASQPFSLGPRSCLGRSMAYFELRLVLARMLWNYDLSLPGGQGTGLVWTDQKTYATWDKQKFEIRIAERPVASDHADK